MEAIRKVDLSALTEERRDELAAQIGKTVSSKINKNVDELREMLAVYGIDLHILWELKPQGDLPSWKQPEWINKFTQKQQKIEPAPAHKETSVEPGILKRAVKWMIK